MQVFVCVRTWRLVHPFDGRLAGPRLPSLSSVTITGQRQQHLRAITEIARDDLECPPQHRENHFLTKRPALVSAGPWKPTGRTAEPLCCLSHLQDWWTHREVRGGEKRQSVWNLWPILRGTCNKAQKKVWKITVPLKGERKKNNILCSARQTWQRRESLE